MIELSHIDFRIESLLNWKELLLLIGRSLSTLNSTMEKEKSIYKTCFLKCKTVTSQKFGNMTQVLWCIKWVFTNSVTHFNSWWNLICLLKSRGNKAVCRKQGSSLLIQHYKADLLHVECLATLCWNTKQRLGCKHLLISSGNRLCNYLLLRKY